MPPEILKSIHEVVRSDYAVNGYSLTRAEAERRYSCWCKWNQAVTINSTQLITHTTQSPPDWCIPCPVSLLGQPPWHCCCPHSTQLRLGKPLRVISAFWGRNVCSWALNLQGAAAALSAPVWVTALGDASVGWGPWADSVSSQHPLVICSCRCDRATAHRVKLALGKIHTASSQQGLSISLAWSFLITVSPPESINTWRNYSLNSQMGGLYKSKKKI